MQLVQTGPAAFGRGFGAEKWAISLPLRLEISHPISLTCAMDNPNNCKCNAKKQVSFLLTLAKFVAYLIHMFTLPLLPWWLKAFIYNFSQPLRSSCFKKSTDSCAVHRFSSTQLAVCEVGGLRSSKTLLRLTSSTAIRTAWRDSRSRTHRIPVRCR